MNDINTLRELLRSKGLCLENFNITDNCFIPQAGYKNNIYSIPQGWIAAIYKVRFISAPAGKRYIIRSNTKYNQDVISGGNNTEWEQISLFESHIYIESEAQRVPDASTATIAVHFLLLEPICQS